ncbi:MAG TPA: hypothetical protein VK963_00085 [Candidatus Saccharimonadales bacterium]|nr:hypothetical protein [Candidatus Saccharimonadales bacterium]
MVVLQQASPSALNDIRREGLKRGSRGEKGDDRLIIQTDEYLDDARPADVKQMGLSRDDNLYAYVVHNDRAIDITDGKAVRVEAFIKNSEQAVLRLSVDPERCYVSDLDAYDTIKKAIKNSEGHSGLRTLARNYWARVVRLDKFAGGSIKRPEVMITYDISPADIEIVSAGK